LWKYEKKTGGELFTLRGNKVERPVWSPTSNAQELGHPEELLQVGKVFSRDPVEAITGGYQK
jgi:hypothetical protein